MSVKDLAQFEFIAPRENSFFAGCEDAEKAILDSWRSGHMHHAWLLCGPTGVGKATLGWRMARYVLAQSSCDSSLPFSRGDSLDMQEDHRVFRQLAACSHPDFFFISDAAQEESPGKRKEIVVDDIRQLQRFLTSSAAEGGWKVALIDSGDSLNGHAANALLKILEEPPCRFLFIIISHNPARLLPTIFSRCRRLSLKPPEASIFSSLLRYYVPDLSSEHIGFLRDLSGYSPGRALRFLGLGGMDIFAAFEKGVLSESSRLLSELADRVSRDVSLFSHSYDIINWWLSSLIKTDASFQKRGVESVRFAELSDRLRERLSRKEGLELFSMAQTRMNAALRGELDRKQVILQVFLMIFNISHAKERIV